MVAQVQSFTSDTQYDLTINEQTGVATDCTCKSRQFNPGKACKHQREFNAEVQRAARFLLAVRTVREMEYQWKVNREMAFSGL
jgi:hypothetical protein